MERVNYEAVLPLVMKQIKQGAFLTALAGDDLNVMTIGWASLGFIWGKSIMTIAVRPTRHTFGIIERATDFTVSVPLSGMDKELEFCGTNSGRAGNKFKKSGLEIFPSIKAHTPILMVPGIHYECRIVFKSPMDPKNLAEDYKHLYPQKDFHTLYFGEILECYSTADERIK
jgi:flavin reductase (DIM6/NTAB) family NADH-FMN oxidoreductase RutF